MGQKSMALLGLLGIIIFLVFFSEYSFFNKKQYIPSGNSITIMTFNVENLFDTKDDFGKFDETFLPKKQKRSKGHKEKCKRHKYSKWKKECLRLDWSEKTLEVKLDRLGRVIEQVKNKKGPDVIVFQEIENINVLKRLKDEKLSHMNFKEIILIEGKDKRGIDIAILSKLKLIEKPVLHDIDFERISKSLVGGSRGILQANFKLPDKKVLTVFGVHFPAPFHSTKSRVHAFKKLLKLKKNLPPGRLVIAAGDFNVSSDEDRRKNILNKLVKKDWTIAHEIGCRKCKGTYYYQRNRSWSFLDMILLSHNFSSKNKHEGWEVVSDSVRLVNSYQKQKNRKGYPNRFKLSKKGGVSDHWPLAVDIIPVNNR